MWFMLGKKLGELLGIGNSLLSELVWNVKMTLIGRNRLDRREHGLTKKRKCYKVNINSSRIKQCTMHFENT